VDGVSALAPVRQRANEAAARAAERRPRLQALLERVSPANRDVRRTRTRLAARFLRGQGLEIGALHLPLVLPRGATARYVDRMPVDALRREYPELRARPLVDVDVIDDGERLPTVADESVDFVVANHFIEHTEDPVATLGAHARVLRPGGVLFMAVPDKRFTFDVRRPVTPLEHLVHDAAQGPEGSRAGHFEEWARLVDGLPEAQVPARAAELQAAGYSIHFHVFTPASFAALLVHCREAAGIPLEIEGIVPVRHEFIALLRRV
jgi:SAM-dependent methyltransferase